MKGCSKKQILERLCLSCKLLFYNKHSDPGNSIATLGWVLHTTSRIKYWKCEIFALCYDLYYLVSRNFTHKLGSPYTELITKQKFLTFYVFDKRHEQNKRDFFQYFFRVCSKEQLETQEEKEVAFACLLGSSSQPSGNYGK